MHSARDSASDDIEIFMCSDTDKVIDILFDTMLQRFQRAIETWFDNGSEFIFENVYLLYCYFHELDMRRDESYMKSFGWLKNKKATINPKMTMMIIVYNTLSLLH